MVVGTWSIGSWEGTLGSGGVLPSLKGLTPTTIHYVGPTLTPSLNGSVARESNLGQLTTNFESSVLEKAIGCWAIVGPSIDIHFPCISSSTFVMFQLPLKTRQICLP